MNPKAIYPPAAATALKVGDRVRDCTKGLLHPRVLVIKRIEGRGDVPKQLLGYATLSLDGGDDSTYQTRVRLDRIHTDDKPRNSGWVRVP